MSAAAFDFVALPRGALHQFAATHVAPASSSGAAAKVASSPRHAAQRLGGICAVAGAIGNAASNRNELDLIW